MKKYLTIITALILSSCSLFQQVHNKRFQRYSNSKAQQLKNDPTLHWDSIVLDKTFELYVRQVCRARLPKGYYLSGDPALPAGVSRCNCEDAPAGTTEKLEIEYLFISAKKNQFVYITTIPPYVDPLPGGPRNTYDQPLFEFDNFANINYFNTFFFGRIDGKQLLMQPYGSDYPYKIDYTQNPATEIFSFDQLYFHQKKMSSARPEVVLSQPIKFHHKEKWMIGLDDVPSVKSLNKGYNNFLENRTIYLLSQVSDPAHQPTDVLFYFNTDYAGIPGQTWQWLHFEDFRIKSF